MNKKSDIIQRLLDDKYITVEEAMTLMATDFMPMPTVPYTPPSTPINPFPQTNPIWYTTGPSCTHTTDVNNNFTAK